VVPIHIDLEKMLHHESELFMEIQERLQKALGHHRSVVLYTSRGERQFPTKAARLAFGARVSDVLVRLVQGLPQEIGFLISKGGITSNDTLSKGLALRTAGVVGQIRPGCSVILCPKDHPRFPELPVVVFPGNVGGDEALAEVYSVLTRTHPEQGTGKKGAVA
jgi:uncharacterized protein YgbK (DUF1537 family)